MRTEHVPSCNPLCHGGEHFLLGDGTFIEYGVIVDRTSQGLGFYLASAWQSLEFAEKIADEHRRDLGFPVAVKARAVTRSEWRDLPGTEAEQVAAT